MHDTMILKGVPSLCILGSPYALDRGQSLFLSENNSSFEINPKENHLFNILF